ncbi:sensor histidine kinase [Caldisalinibacter kiritimatiensis]|uniref:histidine kinase n=1 Tax=Caldisalinibacter kiritimatiensis TaxID=1304284 RepID=R1CD40_9FIRM|nr:HAMP domain-containing sensor histidine kinase [Caldisalinibacter kiritimatiensis]EOD00215.1 sensor histidine kinase [Caldisalinibacter kiritimatiensis]
MTKIGKKLIITYIILLIITFLAITISYNSLSKVYLLNETKQQLKDEGEKIAEILKGFSLDERTIRDRINDIQKLKVAGRFIDSQMIILNGNKNIVYKDTDIKYPQILLRIIRERKNTIKGYISKATPILDDNGNIKGHVVLSTRVENINKLNNLLRRSRRISFTIAGILAFIIGIIFARGITKPIKKLANKMKNFSLKKYEDQDIIKTGDEIEELDKSFREMANRIKMYDEQQKRFFQNTSHELKTPLMSIQGYAEAIKDGIVEGEELEESLDIIINESQRLKKIVDELVYLTKLENAKEHFNFERKNLLDIVNKAVKSVKSLADEKGISIKILHDINHVGMYDEDKLIRAFINILGNGIRYAEKEITINIKDNIDKIVITITDDGTGFNNGEEKKVFDRLYKGNKGNTGIGLAITKAIVNGHKGSITAYNSSTKGAAFEISLPK